MTTKLFLGTLLCSVISINAQVSTINEDFSTFSGTSFPQNGWTSNRVAPYAYFIANDHPQVYSLFDVTNPTYIITPEILSINGTQTIKFDAQVTTGSAGGGTIQVGTLSDPADVNTFVAISGLETLQTAATQYSYTVPSTTAKYIAFKFQPSTVHAALQVDNVVFGPTATLAVSDVKNVKSTPKHVLTSDNQLQFIGNDAVSSIDIFSAGGSRVMGEKVSSNSVNVSELAKGVYMYKATTKQGQVIQSKFIRK
ncbi:T9SS type A sorting domain-containing protein [Chryseobacterium sp. CT-SW4]|uniref:T9SS type A sorting domain-containing protein n=1 Tax=Chryseobacterium sp. SW-1 TaxID=3157343 RepID=UPI003B02B781